MQAKTKSFKINIEMKPAHDLYLTLVTLKSMRLIYVEREFIKTLKPSLPIPKKSTPVIII